MDREKLIRAHFDAYSDLTWAETLEPKFMAEGVEGAELEGFRQAWNRYTEGRDWEWWLEHTAEASDAKLNEEIQECKAEISVIVSKRQGKNGQGALQEILNGTAGVERQPQEQSKTHETGREM